MPKSTADCKKYINSIHSIIGTSTDDEWKRIREYKNGELILRDFENQDGRLLTISEFDNELCLFSLNPPIQKAEFKPAMMDLDEMFVGRKAKKEDILTFMALCVSNDPMIVDEEAEGDALECASWQLLEQKPMTAQEWIDAMEVAQDNDAFPLYHRDIDGTKLYLKPDDVARVYVLWMPEYENRYRFAIYETNDNYLLLGENNHG